LQLFLKRLEVGEGAIYGGESDVGYFIQGPQLVHDQLADDVAGYLCFLTAPAGSLNLIDQAFDGFRADWPLLAGFLDPESQLYPVEGFPPAILFYDQEVHHLGLLVAAEASATATAEPASTSGPRRQVSFIYYFGLVMTAIWALQGIVSCTIKC